MAIVAQDIHCWDLLWYYRTKPDPVTGQSVISAQAFVEVRSVHLKTGQISIRIRSGGEYINQFPSMRMVKIGNRVFPPRMNGIVHDAVTEYGPRSFMYAGVDDPSKFMDPAYFIDLRGNLKSMYDEDFGGWFTEDGTETGKGIEGFYLKNFFGKGRFVFIGDSYFKGNVIIGENGVVKNLNAGVGGQGVIWDETGLKGYDSILGRTFFLPVDGSAPQFSSGIIREAIYEITTNSIFRTHENVGLGEAGALINNTGFYYCNTGQSLAEAAVCITGTIKRFTGDVFVTGGNVIVTGEAAADINSHPTTVSGTRITDNSITVDKLYVSSLSAITANLGLVTAGSITGVSIYGTAIEVSAGYGLSFVLQYSGSPVTVGNLAGGYTTWNKYDGVGTTNRFYYTINSSCRIAAPAFSGQYRMPGLQQDTGNYPKTKYFLTTDNDGYIVESSLSALLGAGFDARISDLLSRVVALEGGEPT